MTDFDFSRDLAEHARALEPSEADLERLTARVLAAPPPRRRRHGILLAAGLAAAAGLAVLVPEGPREVVLEPGELALSAGVSASSTGTGVAEVDGARTVVRWEEGALTLDVTPDAGLAVAVHTGEAVVRVVGTVFTVDRGPFGTDVGVEHGRVEVTCSSGATHVLTPGGGAFCPRDAGAGLGRLLALEAGGAPAVERLRTIEAGLAHAEGLQATRETLLDRRVDVLVELGRTDEAIAAAAELGPASLTRGAEAAMARGGCDAAGAWLLAMQHAGDPVGTLLRVQCLAGSDPAAARAALDTLDRLPLTPEQAEAAARWRAALGG